MSEALLVRFAQEELVYLLRALKIDTLPGLEANPLVNLDHDHQALALAVADRTLRARGSISWQNSEHRQVDAIVAGILHDCACPEYTVLVDTIGTDGLNLRALYTFGGRAIIEHVIPEPGIHQFMVFSSLRDVLTQLHGLIVVEGKEKARSIVSYLSQEQLARAHEVAPNSPDKAMLILTDTLPAEIAQDLASVLSGEVQIQHLALWVGTPKQFQNNEPETVLTIIQGVADLFLLWKEKKGTVQFEVISATVQQARQYIQRLLTPVHKSASKLE